MAETRKQKEADFHDHVRSEEIPPEEWEYLNSNKKWYLVTQASRDYIAKWLKGRAPGKRVLDYCCGEGEFGMLAARLGATVTGVDISPYSVDKANRKAKELGLDNCNFIVGDAENLNFQDESFDIVCESGVLHHLNLAKAYAEMARVLVVDGEVICNETLVHNPLIRAYRSRTPHLRTEYEVRHILSVQDVMASRLFFEDLQLKYFHLASIAVVPLRKTPLFEPALAVADKVDDILLKVPFLNRMAWQVVFTGRKAEPEEDDDGHDHHH